MIGQFVAQVRLWIVLGLGLGIVVIDSVSRTISMLADLGLITLMVIVLLPVLKKDATTAKQ